MAFTNFVPKFHSQEGQNAETFKIWDESTWSGEESLCTEANLYLSYYNTIGEQIEGAMYPLISGGDRTKLDEYISNDGHVINISDIFPLQERFVDGYYVIVIIFDDGTYAVIDKPRYTEHQAFLAKLRCMSRKMPMQVVDWPDYDRKKLLDSHVLTLLLDNAEDAADLGKRILFEKIVRTLNKMFDQYQITECF